MPVATKSLKCPTCGAKSRADAARCRICTRSFPQDSMPSQVAFEDALYSSPIRGAAPARRALNLTPYIAVIVAALLTYNYFSLGYGPSWAHRPTAHQPGGNWRTFTGVPGLTVFLPGDPITDATSTSDGNLRSARVGVDDHWDPILDAGVTSSGAKREAASNLTATLAVGTTAIPPDISASAVPLLAALVPGARLSEPTLVERRGLAAGTAYDLVAAYSGYPDASTHGTVRARIVIASGRAHLAASFFPGTQSLEMHEHLLEGFSPDGAP